MLNKHTTRIDIQNLALLCLISFFSLSVSAISDLESFDKIDIVINHAKYRLEIAKTQAQRSQGLMFRPSLANKEGMLFIYNRPGDHRIWMKNTLIPLTVIWVDEDDRVIAIKLLQPCDTAFCTSYGVSQPSLYVIELNAGSHDINPGDSISGLKLLE